MEKDSWWKISLVLSVIQMILFTYLDYIVASSEWFFSFGFIVLLFIGLLFFSIILIALKKKIGYELGLFFSVLGIMCGTTMLAVSYVFQYLNLTREGLPLVISFAFGVEPVVFLIFVVIPIALIYAINKEISFWN